MEFYKSKRMAMDEISKRIEGAGVIYVKPLCFLIERKYGFSERWVMNYIKKLDELNIAKYDESAGTIQEIKINRKDDEDVA